MALLVTNEGERALLKMALKDAAPEALVLKLYKNDHDPAEGDDATDFTEADIAGYVAIALARATWNDPTTDGGGVSTISFPQQTFQFTGDGEVVGYYVVGAVSGTLLWAERLYAAPDYPAAGQHFQNGDSLKLTPRIGLD
jgi:hypothetical protein